MSNKRRDQLKRRRKKLFDEQDGKCCFCNTNMLLPDGPPPKGKPMSLDTACLYHLDDRYEPKRGHRGKNKQTTVCCCRKCSDERSARSERSQPIDRLRARATHTTGTPQ